MSMQFKIKNSVLVAALGLVIAAPSAIAASFSFGIMADTQWMASSTTVTGGENTVATGIIDSLNQQFIGKKVDFVVQVGDLTDNGSTAAMQTRANSAQALYDAGIGFMPLRGNHESSKTAAVQFQGLYQQTQGTGANALAGASNFSSPTGMAGLSYSFDYKNTRFVMLDQFTQPNGTSQSTLNQTQVNWVSSTLSSKPASSNAFVFSHKGLITENHADTLFGSNPSSGAALQNQFIKSLSDNGVKYLINGHDHMDNRAIVTSPDGTSKVQNITAASDSYKFYTPVNPSNDAKYDNPTRETQISQQLFNIGYYIVNVDGPKVTVDYYASPNGCNGDCDLKATPNLNFSKQETFGYSLNGKSFAVQAGASFAGIKDQSAGGTQFEILQGINGADVVNAYDSRKTIADVNTGWTAKEEIGNGDLRSDELSLWGVTDLSNTSSNRIRVAVSYSGDGPVHIVTRNADGKLVEFGTNQSYDAATRMAYADIDTSALDVTRIAVAAVPEPETYALMLAGLGLVGFMARRRAGKSAR